MLQEKLEAASQEAQRRWVRRTVALVAAGAVVLLFLLGIIRLDLTPILPAGEPETAVGVPSGVADPPVARTAGTGLGSASSEAPRPETEQTETEQTETDQTETQQAGTPSLDAALGQSATPSIPGVSRSVEATPADPPRTPSLSEGAEADDPSDPPADPPQVSPQASPQASAQALTPDQVADRAAFQTELADYQTTLLPALDDPDFARWAPETRDRIADDVAAAQTSFATGDYGPALAALRGAVATARQAIDDRDRSLGEALENAEAALDADLYEEALLEVEKALRIRPGSTQAADLKAEIEQLPDLLEALQDAAVARAENDLAEEARRLRRVLTLAPDRSEARTRLRAVEEQIEEEAFADAIAAGLAGIENRDVETAARQLSRAEALFPDRSETEVLASRTAALTLELQVEELVRKTIVASQADNWGAALLLFTSAEQIIPNNKDARDGMTLAAEVIDLKTRVQAHLNAPHRLSSANVETAARGTLSEARVFATFSPSLSADARQLSEVIDTYTTPLPVTVVSDGATDITVRGVGQVGLTTSRTIELKPGTYTFEGVRAGYQSKLIPVTLEPGMTNVVVEVICDERL